MTTLTLPMPPSLNNAYFNLPRGGRAPSARLAQWKRDAGFLLIAQRPPKIKGPVRLEYLFEEAATKADLSNLVKHAEDLLVTHKVIEEDRGKYVRDFRVRWALGIEGCQVTIVNLRPQEAAALEYLGEGG